MFCGGDYVFSPQSGDYNGRHAVKKDKELPLVRRSWTQSRITAVPAASAVPRCAGVSQTQVSSAGGYDALPGSDRLFVVEQLGKILSFAPKSEAEKADLFLDLAGDFKSLVPHPNAKGITASYGLVFHPKFAENHQCFVTYGLASSKDGAPLKDGGRLSRFKVTQLDPPRMRSNSEEVLLTWLEGGHMGSAMAFGPDGMLYVSTGDGGPAAPPDREPHRTRRR